MATAPQCPGDAAAAAGERGEKCRAPWPAEQRMVGLYPLWYWFYYPHLLHSHSLSPPCMLMRGLPNPHRKMFCLSGVCFIPFFETSYYLIVDRFFLSVSPLIHNDISCCSSHPVPYAPIIHCQLLFFPSHVLCQWSAAFLYLDYSIKSSHTFSVLKTIFCLKTGFAWWSIGTVLDIYSEQGIGIEQRH